MGQRLQDVGDLPESQQHRLLVVSRGFLEGRERSAAFRLSHATVEDRLRKSGGDAPDQAGWTEQIAAVQ